VDTASQSPELVRHWSLPAKPNAVSRARRELREQCAAWALSGREAEDLVLVADELLSNAVLHAAGPVLLTVRAGQSHVYVAVLDREPDAHPRRQGAGIRAESGRGLSVVETLATAWDSERQTHGSKLVWATIRRRPAT
jgi:anti-sigma regulatory factor (Ser/Thr protein kinase)